MFRDIKGCINAMFFMSIVGFVLSAAALLAFLYWVIKHVSISIA